MDQREVGSTELKLPTGRLTLAKQQMQHHIKHLIEFMQHNELEEWSVGSMMEHVMPLLTCPLLVEHVFGRCPFGAFTIALSTRSASTAMFGFLICFGDHLLRCFPLAKPESRAECHARLWCDLSPAAIEPPEPRLARSDSRHLQRLGNQSCSPEQHLVF